MKFNASRRRIVRFLNQDTVFQEHGFFWLHSQETLMYGSLSLLSYTTLIYVFFSTLSFLCVSFHYRVRTSKTTVPVCITQLNLDGQRSQTGKDPKYKDISRFKQFNPFLNLSGYGPRVTQTAQERKDGELTLTRLLSNQNSSIQRQEF